MPSLQLKHVNKVYSNKVQAVFDFNLDIEDHEFIVFVGPSGCGKSTTLRMIAGLEEITSGELYIDGVLSNHLLAKDRDIAMVFQSYALYPHMTVYANMAFGLKMRKVDKQEIDRRVKEAAKILELENLLDRKPKALSGGQRQRVALGRAIVRNANVFLMDEPLSNLDAKLRVQMRSEIIRLHERLGTTTIYVTHDQTEAMTMATRIVVMKDGWIQQVGTPKEIFEHPKNKFVASFIGSPSMNFFPVQIEGSYFLLCDKKFKIPDHLLSALKPYDQKEMILGIRPSDIVLSHKKNALEVESDVIELLGKDIIIHSTYQEHPFEIVCSSKENISPHQTIKIELLKNGLHFFDKDSEEAIEESSKNE